MIEIVIGIGLALAGIAGGVLLTKALNLNVEGWERLTLGLSLAVSLTIFLLSAINAFFRIPPSSIVVLAISVGIIALSLLMMAAGKMMPKAAELLNKLRRAIVDRVRGMKAKAKRSDEKPGL